MNESEIKFFLAIAKYQSITRAAESLYVSQPYLSRALMHLEKRHGVQLFDRSKLPICLTLAGERYLEYCHKFMQLQQELEKELHSISSFTSSRLTIGVPPIRGSYILPIVLPLFTKIVPNVEVKIVEEKSNIIPLMVETGEIDIGIFSLPDKPHRIISENILEDKLLLMVYPNHLLYYLSEDASQIATLSKEMMNLLNGANFISLDSPYSITKRLIRYLETQNIYCRISIKTKNNVMTYRLCEKGMGMAAIMEVAARNTPFNMQPCLYKIGEPPLSETWYVSYQDGKVLSPIEELFLKIIKKQALILNSLQIKFTSK